eukprot:130130_1
MQASNVVALTFLMFVAATFSISAYLSQGTWIKQTIIVSLPIVLILRSSYFVKTIGICGDRDGRDSNMTENKRNSCGDPIWEIQSKKSEQLSPINDILFDIDDKICEQLANKVIKLMRPLYWHQHKIQEIQSSINELTAQRFTDFKRYYQSFIQHVENMDRIILNYENECILTESILSPHVFASKKTPHIFSRNMIILLSLEFVLISILRIFSKYWNFMVPVILITGYVSVIKYLFVKDINKGTKIVINIFDAKKDHIQQIAKRKYPYIEISAVTRQLRQSGVNLSPYFFKQFCQVLTKNKFYFGYSKIFYIGKIAMHDEEIVFRLWQEWEKEKWDIEKEKQWMKNQEQQIKKYCKM